MGTGVPADLITRSLYRLELCQRQILKVIAGLNLPADDVERLLTPAPVIRQTHWSGLHTRHQSQGLPPPVPPPKPLGAEATASPAVPEIRTSTVVAAAKILRVLCCLQ